MQIWKNQEEKNTAEQEEAYLKMLERYGYTEEVIVSILENNPDILTVGNLLDMVAAGALPNIYVDGDAGRDHIGKIVSE